MKQIPILLSFAVVACTTESSGGFQNSAGSRVNPVSENVFEVIVRPGNEYSKFWCGAGDYAARVLGAPANARLYVVGGAGQAVTMSSPNGAQFSLVPPEQAKGATGRNSGWGPKLGRNEFVGDAQLFCWGDPERFVP